MYEKTVVPESTRKAILLRLFFKQLRQLDRGSLGPTVDPP